ncbi:MAG: hypothetical protein M3360_04525 [Actinomycetota bacterium]|nr:hypothetical protein [Actinomycetota bacterium]
MPRSELRPLGVAEIVDVALKVYLRHAPSLFNLVAIVVVPVQLLQLLFTLSITPAAEAVGSGTLLTGTVTGADAPTVAGLVFGGLLVGLLTFVATTLATGACFKAVADAYLGDQPDTSQSLRFARGRLGSLMLVSFLGAVLAFLGFLLFVLPGVYLWIAFSVAAPVVLFEGMEGTGALGRSRRLVQGRWWRVFGTLLLGFILAAIVGGIITSVLTGVLAVGAGSGDFVEALVGAVAGSVAAIVTTPFQAALIAILFFDLKVRKEGFDAALLADGMAAPPSRAAPEDRRGIGPSERAPEPPPGG